MYIYLFRMLIVVMSEGVVCSVCNYISELRSRLDKALHHHKVTIEHYTNSDPGNDRVHFMLLAKNTEVFAKTVII